MTVLWAGMPWVEYDGAPPADTGPGYQYAALAFSPPEAPAERRVLPDGNETLGENVLALIPREAHDTWRESLGTYAWRKLETTSRVVVAREPALGPSTGYFLRARVARTWDAFLLCGEAANSGRDAWILHGETDGDRPGSHLLTVLTSQEMNRIFTPPYQAERQAKMLATSGWRPDDSWLVRWAEVCGLLRHVQVPQLLDLALLAHGSAWTQRLLEFSIPEFVRAAEGVLALPDCFVPPYPPRTDRLGGWNLFRDRALHLVPSLRKDDYVGADAEVLLRELYEARNDCVHGKVPFRTLRSRGAAEFDRACRLAYLAEVLAREALLVALRHHDASVFESREALEGAWATGAFPPSMASG